MTESEKLAGIRRSLGESVVYFREKIRNLMSEWGYDAGDVFEEKGGKVAVHTYNGLDGQLLAFKFATGSAGSDQLKWGNDSTDRYDTFVLFRNIPEPLRKKLIKDLNFYDDKNDYDIEEIVGIFKAPGEARRDFRTRLEDFLGLHNFKGGAMESSDNGDLLYRIYQTKDGQMIEMTYAGDKVSDTLGFDYVEGRNFAPYCSEGENLVDAAMIFNGVKRNVKERINEGLESKFIV